VTAEGLAETVVIYLLIYVSCNDAFSISGDGASNTTMMNA